VWNEQELQMHRPGKHDDVTTPAVALAWEGGRIDEMRGDARRLLLSRMVIDHRLQASDPFRLTENSMQRAVTGHLLGERSVGMAEVGELLVGA
jgi:acyl-CoA dehydrogenase